MPINMIQWKYLFAATSLVAIIILVACGGLNIYSPQDDVKLGKQLAQQISENPQEYPILNNPNALAYLQNMVNTLIQSPDIKFRGVFPYQVAIINNDKVINAFAAPGGYLYVYTGLLKFVDNEATLAGIIAHEIGHAENRHSTKRMTKAYGTQLLTQLALGDSKNKTAEMAANLFSGLALLKNSRDDEYEADESSFRYLLTTGKWYPGAIRLFFDKIDGSTKGRSDVAEGFKTLLSTHPLGPDRVEAVDKLLKQNNIPPPNESNLRYREYLDFKKLLQ